MTDRHEPHSLTFAPSSLCAFAPLRETPLRHAAGRPLLGAADGDAADEHRRHADADGDGLAGLAAGPAAVAEDEVRTDLRHLGEHVGAVADQAGVADGGGDAAVLDQI